MPAWPLLGSLPETIQKVAQGQKGMAICHPGAGMPHHGLDEISLVRTVTVDLALGAGCLRLLERAFVQAGSRILPEFLAAIA